MRASLVLLLASMALVGCKSTSFWSVEKTNADTLRTVSQGQVLGGEGRYGSHAWLGIPFAKPPTGALRWRSPEPPLPWAGVREATHFGPVCPQVGTMLAGGKDDRIIGDEDCLSLSIWAPRFTPSEVPQGAARLPVMVWIHGGGDSIGTAAFYDGGRLAAEEKVIVVAVQYRLGPLGWLRHGALRAQASEVDASGNFGTLDLIRSLEWVRDNVAAFGGDPGNVTIFGESAGGLNVYTLLLAPAAKGLFHRAISESGGLWLATTEEAEGFVGAAPSVHRNSSDEVLARLMVTEGRASDAADARTKLKTQPADELARWMRGVTPEALLKAYVGGAAGMLDAPLVFQDGVVLPKGDLVERFSSPSGWNQVPVLIGTNRDEMRLFLFLDRKHVHRILGLFPRMVDEPAYLANADVASRFWKLNGVDLPVAAMARGGAKELFAYRWDWHEEPTVMGGDFSVMLGAAHGLEVPFVFGHFDMGPFNVIFDEAHAPAREAVSSAMRQYWAQFARTGDPGRGTSGSLPAWSTWSPPGATHLIIDTPGGGGIRMGALLEAKQAILDSLFADSRLDARERCRVFRDMTTWGRFVSRAEYDAHPACRAFPYTEYPWAR